jgi:Mlc titration factor MtfA (ptsG expression regulator)
MLAQKYSLLYQELMDFYRQDTAAIAYEIAPKENAHRHRIPRPY